MHNLALLILAPVGAATAIATLVFIIAFVFNYDSVTRPMLDFFTKRGGGWLGGLIRWVTRPLKSRIENFVKEHVAGLRRQLYANETLLVTALDSTADVVQRLAGTIGDMSEQTWRALWTLNNETVPRKIAAALVPIRNTLTRHTDRLDAIEDLNRRTAVVVGAGLRSLPWGAPGTYVGNFEQWWNSYRHLWSQTFGTLMPRVNELWSERVENLRDRFNELETRVTLIREEALPAIRQRIGRIEESIEGILSDPTTWILAGLGAAMLPALSSGGMRAALRNLTCRNTQEVSRNLCSMDETLLAQLLAGTLLWALVLDPRIIARSGQAVMGGMGSIWRETALR